MGSVISSSPFSAYSSMMLLLTLTVFFSYCISRCAPRLLQPEKSLGALRFSVSRIGHRGSRLEGVLENTIVSFKDAIDAGADVIELDVWLSKDGKVVVFHDDDFSRMTGHGNGPDREKHSQRADCRPRETCYRDYPSLVPPSEQEGRLHLFPEVKEQRDIACLGA